MSSKSHSLMCYHYDSSACSFATKSVSKALGYADILIQTTHSGICFTDVHAKEKGCGLGHEGIGWIVEVGPAVKAFRPNDRVGWGWLHSSCGHCTPCVSGYRQYCAEARGFGFSDLDQGAFGDLRIVDSEFAYLIPDGIESIHAAPLMCAGASVFEALHAAGVQANHRVGVVGVGGLGHIAILFAKAMGCAVTAISSGSDKKKDAFELGADEFRYSRAMRIRQRPGITEIDAQPMNINVLLITSNAVPKLETVLPFLARRATIVLMTIQEDALEVPYMQFILPGHRLIASTEASRQNHLDMLEFADRHHIKPWVEVFDMDDNGLSKAFQKLEDGEMRYRGVLARTVVGG